MIDEHQLNSCFWKKITWDDAKKTMQKRQKRLTEMQVSTKDFTSYKIRYKSLRKRKSHS